jgi:peptidase A4-like protein
MEDEGDQPTLVERIKDFDIPPENLDLITATPEQLQPYGVPPRPDPELQPQLYEAWGSFFVPRPTFVLADILVTNEFRPQLRRTSVPTAPFASPSTRYETSRNWSGTYIEPNDDKVFIHVSGKWIVPTPAVPANAQPPDNGSVVYACSAWVGSDGQRRYRDSSLPQIGTWQAVRLFSDGSENVETYAWFQWWARNYGGNAPGIITSVPVDPGDEVICMVRVWRPSIAVVYIRNLTTGRLAHFRIRAPVVNGHRFTISGATAEWIVERPTRLDNGELYDLADYGSIELLQCHAAEADPTLPNWPWVLGTNQTLGGARFIRMYDLLRNPTRTAFISMPQKESDSSARVSYGGFLN